MYTNEVNALIAAANDARHCLAAVTDESLKGSIDRTITSLEQTIANVRKCYSVPAATLPAMGWVKNLPRPTGSSKESFIDMKEAEMSQWQSMRGNDGRGK